MAHPGTNRVNPAEDLPRDGRAVTKRTVGLFGAISLVVGTMIGSGIFASAQTVAGRSGSAGMILVTWAGTGTIAVLGALCYAELGTTIQNSGGEYSYLFTAFGPVAAFTFSWVSIVVLRPAGLSAVCLVCGSYIVEAVFGCDVQFSFGFTRDQVTKILAAATIGTVFLSYHFIPLTLLPAL